MTTLFLSDVHLDDRRPQPAALLKRFLCEQAPAAKALYILGDLFESWVGDDAPPACSQEIGAALSRLSEEGVECYFTHGNRDFLLGESYARAVGMKLLPGEHVATIDGEQVLLLHGDTLCIDDVPYQQFRKTVRDPAWQREFLARPPAQRRQIAMQARDASAMHKGGAATDILDVNPQEVVRRLRHHRVNRMIHGHTHRPGTHELQLDGRSAQRIVLGDWHTSGSVLRARGGNYQLSVFR